MAVGYSAESSPHSTVRGEPVTTMEVTSMASATDIEISQDFASILLTSAKACKDTKTHVSALVGANKELAHRGPELFRAILEEFHPTTREYFPNRQTSLHPRYKAVVRMPSVPTNGSSI